MKRLMIAVLPLALAGCPWDKEKKIYVEVPSITDESHIQSGTDDANYPNEPIEADVTLPAPEGANDSTPVRPTPEGDSGDHSDETGSESPESPSGSETPDGEVEAGQPDQSPEPQEPSGTDWREAMLIAVNATRAVGRNCGAEFYPAVAPVRLNETLNLAAQWHSEDMATQNYFSHTGLDGRDPGQRITDAGYVWRTYGENIAAGQADVDAVMQAWINSPGHCANIMGANFEEVGFGMIEMSGNRYGIYWTQKFGTQR